MSDNKKYYYLKLKEGFFDSDEMQILESMPDGIKYSNILLKLYLKSIKNEGKLMFKERIPYNSNILATLTRSSIGDIEKALKIFKDLGLIEIMDNGAIYMLDIQNFIGLSSTEADRKRTYRQRIDKEKINCGQLGGQMSRQISDKNPLELELELELEIKKDIDIKAKKKRKTFIIPSIEEISTYCKERNNSVDAQKFSDFYTSKGWFVGKNKMKDWKASVRTWEQNSKKTDSKIFGKGKENEYCENMGKW